MPEDFPTPKKSLKELEKERKNLQIKNEEKNQLSWQKIIRNNFPGIIST